MHLVDIVIFLIYFLTVLCIGFFFYKKNETPDDYFVGGRNMGSLHIGLSVVATDVGGGFSIGLGGLGFIMGISGSWLLFTGFLGAWLSGVFLIPVVFRKAVKKKYLTLPQLLEDIFNKRVALFAGIISSVGYLGFTSSQILAGAKLASSTFSGLSMENALLIMGVIAILYTSLGGMKAVIYTDTIQWIVLLAGLLFIALPFSFVKVGGMDVIRDTLPSEFFSLKNVSWSQLINWLFTILPVWFIGMTLYQRIYASKNQKTAQRGWFIAGIFEYPIMAFTGVILGMFARVAFENGVITELMSESIDAEMGLPLLLKAILPVGFMGIVLSAYFSAIMSTADSCLMASSGNILTDILNKHNDKNSLKYSQVITLLIGCIALLLALKMNNVLELMLYSYSFMVSGMIVPVLAGLFFKAADSSAALISMITGGVSTLILIVLNINLPFGFDPIIPGIFLSTMMYFVVYHLSRNNK